MSSSTTMEPNSSHGLEFPVTSMSYGEEKKDNPKEPVWFVESYGCTMLEPKPNESKLLVGFRTDAEDSSVNVVEIRKMKAINSLAVGDYSLTGETWDSGGESSHQTQARFGDDYYARSTKDMGRTVCSSPPPLQPICQFHSNVSSDCDPVMKEEGTDTLSYDYYSRSTRRRDCSSPPPLQPIRPHSKVPSIKSSLLKESANILFHNVEPDLTVNPSGMPFPAGASTDPLKAFKQYSATFAQLDVPMKPKQDTQVDSRSHQTRYFLKLSSGIYIGTNSVSLGVRPDEESDQLSFSLDENTLHLKDNDVCEHILQQSKERESTRPMHDHTYMAHKEDSSDATTTRKRKVVEKPERTQEKPKKLKKGPVYLRGESWKLRQIQRIVHQPKEFQCKMCGRCFSLVTDFEQHLEKQHEDQVERFRSVIAPLLEELRSKRLVGKYEKNDSSSVEVTEPKCGRKRKNKKIRMQDAEGKLVEEILRRNRSRTVENLDDVVFAGNSQGKHDVTLFEGNKNVFQNLIKKIGVDEDSHCVGDTQEIHIDLTEGLGEIYECEINKDECLRTCLVKDQETYQLEEEGFELRVEDEVCVGTTEDWPSCWEKEIFSVEVNGKEECCNTITRPVRPKDVPLNYNRKDKQTGKEKQRCDVKLGMEESKESVLTDLSSLGKQVAESSEEQNCRLENGYQSCKIFPIANVSSSKQNNFSFEGGKDQRSKSFSELSKACDDKETVQMDNVEHKTQAFSPEMDAQVLLKIEGWCDVRVPCRICGEFVRHLKILHHIRSVHKDLVSCGKCTKTFIMPSKLASHRKVCTGTSETGDDETEQIVCERCGSTFKHFVSYYQHVRHVHDRKWVSCKICDRKFTTLSALNRHEKVHSSVRNFLCPECGRGFTQPGNLKTHMRLHTATKPYQCDVCDKSYTHNVTLKTHKKRDHGIDMWVVKSSATGRPKRKKDKDD